MSISHVTTHVLDTGSGKPAAAVPVTLHVLDGERWVRIADGATDADGRIKELGPERLPSATYRLAFDTGKYFAASGT
ncbi:hydroxyisourate hydrolase, partial [Arthrobacter sp. AL08]